ncbi:unnamed protein product [Paramecium sonneborni]|uniref:Uncharacterized protein n=1 Tax=Paramecium sonneborni TaxID=65129 RepID=A0A8S1M9J2_9CILI|nr:unnamed protein product [Paramecium sonneborni]
MIKLDKITLAFIFNTVLILLKLLHLYYLFLNYQKTLLEIIILANYLINISLKNINKIYFSQLFKFFVQFVFNIQFQSEKEFFSILIVTL